MGRLKGSKNKPKETIINQEQEIALPIVKRGRGRPRKINPIVEGESVSIADSIVITGNEKDIKSEIRRLKKLKLQCRAGSKERIELHRQIKELKKKKTIINTSMPEKEPIITEILSLQEQYKITPTFEVLGIDLHKFSVEQLNKHLEVFKRKRGI